MIPFLYLTSLFSSWTSCLEDRMPLSFSASLFLSLSLSQPLSFSASLSLSLSLSQPLFLSASLLLSLSLSQDRLAHRFLSFSAVAHTQHSLSRPSIHHAQSHVQNDPLSHTSILLKLTLGSIRLLAKTRKMPVPLCFQPLVKYIEYLVQTTRSLRPDSWVAKSRIYDKSSHSI
jgi:hypothetical protein